MRRSLLSLLAVVLAACGPAEPPAAVLEGHGVTARFDEAGGLVVSRGDAVVLESHPGELGGSEDPLRAGAAYAPFAAARTRSRNVEALFGFFSFEETASPFAGLTPVDVHVDGDRLVFAFAEGGDGALTPGPDGDVHLVWTVPPSVGDRLSMTFTCREGERFFGLGAQVYAEHHGFRVPIWTSEQGVGKGERGEGSPLFGVVGAAYDSYAPVPFALSSRPLGLALGGTRHSVFDLCEDGERLRIETEGPRFDLWIYTADAMSDVLQAFTGRTGRFQPVPRWTWAPWVDAFGGPDAIDQALAALRADGIPASALWAEDWVGTTPALGGENLTYDWEEDPARYPDLAATAAAVHAAGLRLLVYVNPYVPVDTQAYQDLLAVGGLTRDADGNVLEISFPFGAPPAWLDPTAPGAKDVLYGYLDRAVAKGVDGWMADYGEELPWDAVLADGRTGAEAHNDYPRMWAQLNRTYWEARHPQLEHAMFSRSGFTGTMAEAHVMWLGDQLTSFDRKDGLGSVLPLYLSAGLSGFSIVHSDVGGYTAAPGYPRDLELFARWLSLEAFTPVLRTHHTSDPAGAVQWWTDETTRALFRRYARWHQHLVPYWATLGSDAADLGVPAVRPLWWGAEDRTDLFEVDDAVKVGDDLVLAPILAAGETTREVPLPPGAWRRWTTEDGPLGAPETGTVTADAALEDPILYVRAGAALPLLAEDYDTLAPPRAGAAVDDAVRVAPPRIDRLRLLLVGGGDGAGRLHAPGFVGSDWRWEGRAVAAGPLTAARLDGRTLPACADAASLDCLDGAKVRLGPAARGASIELDAGGGTGRLTVGGDAARIDVEVR